MNLYHARYFVDAVRENSISRSAARHRVNHSTVSQAIRTLERFLGVELLRHSKRRFELTSAGENAYRELDAFLENFERAQERILDNESAPVGELSFCAPQSLYIHSLYRTLHDFRSRYPGVRLRLQTGAAAAVRHQVLNGQRQMGLLVDDAHLSDFESRTLRKGEFWLVSKKADQRLGSAELIVTSKEKIEVEHLRRQAKTALKERWPSAMEVISWSVIRSLVTEGFGHGYVPDYVVAEDIRKERLHRVALPGRPFRYEIKAIWLKGRDPHPNARRFLELLKL